MKKLLLSFVFILYAVLKGFSQYTPPDGSFTLAMGPNDDGSTGSIALPFTFCLYGTSYTSLYINNNGNVSFGTSYGSFSSSPFPSPSYVMLAAFWGDVDTRTAGTVQYKITPTAMYINWAGVGYFPQMSDKVNTFQLILTDGLDPVLPAGSNIAFYYGDMQWTTGSASSGVNGFGGVPATVGINKGDGVNYIQIGRFDQAGNAFAGPTDSHSGVDWLDNKSFFFNACTLPTATITGTTTVCNNTAPPDITFTGGGATAPYTFTYTINGGSVQTITTSSGNSVTVAAPTAATGSFTYALVSVQYSGSATPALTQGSAIVTVNPCTLATATITGTTTVCENAAPPDVTFTGAAGTAPYTFIYTINGGAAQTVVTTSGSSVTVAVPTASAGTFIYSLVSVQDVSSTTSAQASGSATITIALPTASIAGTTAVCQNGTAPDVTFTGAGGTAPYTFTYTINSGSSQTVISTGNTAVVSAQASVPGVFTYNLLSVQDAGLTPCSQIQSGTAVITVNPLPTASITGAATLCKNAAAPLITLKGAGGTAPYTFIYTINGAAQPALTTAGSDSSSITAPTGTAGTFIYALVSVQDASSTGCLQAQNDNAVVTVNPNPVAMISGTAAVCKDGASPDITFTGSSGTPPYTFTYAINNGTNQTIISTGNTAVISVSSAVPGVFTYNLLNVQDLAASACSQVHTGTAVITVNPLPTASIAGTAVLCRNAASPNIIFTGAGASAPYTFIYSINGITQPALTTSSGSSISIPAPTAAAGTFTYSLVSVQDASSTACLQAQSGTAVITVNPNAVAAFSSTKVCFSNVTQFYDSSSTSAGTIGTWVWKLGDGSPINTNQNLSYTYASGGIYNVELTVINSFGCADSITKPVKVYYNPTSNFTHADVCFGDSIHFVNTSSINPASSIASYLWVFGDGGATSSLKNPAHYYSSAGTYNATLICTSADGCSSVVNIPVKAFAPPVSAFTPDNACLHDSAHFINTSLNPSAGTIASWSWNFGDGSAINTTAFSSSHLFAAAGQYTVTLITHSSNLGCADTAAHTITVFHKPSAGFTFTNVCLNNAMNFLNASTVLNDTIAGWSWNFGNGPTLNSNQNPSLVYANYGTYSVSLVVTTNNGCKDTISKNVKVHPLPSVQFSSSNVCDGAGVEFTNLSSIPPGDTLHTYGWDYGDGSAPSTNQNTSHLFASAGSYPVTLSVVSNFGCSNSITKNSIVNPNPVVKFTAADTLGCETLCPSFQDLSIIASGSSVYWQWNFGDGAVSISHNPQHCYVNDSVFAPNYFNVTLTVTSDSGCYSVLTKNNFITVYPNPKASFTAEPQIESIINPVFSLKDFSTGANLWLWNFGDSVSSTLQNPGTHTYNDTGSYKITLVVSTQYGCVDSTYKIVSIIPEFAFYIPNTFSPNGDGINDVFSGKGLFFTDYQMIIFDRWGNLVFYSDDINNPWDGKANYGKATAQQDIYVYTIDLTDNKKQKHSYKGIVTLIR